MVLGSTSIKLFSLTTHFVCILANSHIKIKPEKEGKNIDESSHWPKINLYICHVI